MGAAPKLEDRIRLWAELWRSEPFRMVDECYAEDCKAFNMLTGEDMSGREGVRAAERRILALGGDRHVDISKMIVSGQDAALELVVSINGAKTNVCVFMTFGDDGLIVSDHTYARSST
jgi:ketosteroid isomerase-like protein